MSISDEQLLANFSKDMRQSTLDNYLVRLNKIQTLTGGQSLYYIMTHPQHVFQILEEAFPNQNASRANYITPIAKLFTTNAIMLTKHQKSYDSWKEHLKRERDDEIFRYKQNKPTEKQERNLVHYREVSAKYEEMRKNHEVYHDRKTNLHMVLFGVLMHLRPKRADLGNVRLLKQEPKNNIGNYIILDNSPRLVMNDYKTAGKHKSIIEDINVELHEILLASLKEYPRKHLFVNQQGLPYLDNRAYSHFVRAAFKHYFGKAAGVSLWRHIHVTERINPLTMTEHELEREAHLMGHSVTQQRVVYRWVDKNQSCKTTCTPIAR
jgi:hypothetical protein